MVRAGVTGLLDHGVAYKLSALRSAWAYGSRVVLEDRDGDHVFETIEIDGRSPMEDFSAVQARRFAAAVDHAIRARR